MPQEDLLAGRTRAFWLHQWHQYVSPDPEQGRIFHHLHLPVSYWPTLQMRCCKSIRVLATKPQLCFLQVSMNCPGGFIFLVLETVSRTPDNVLFCSAVQGYPGGRYTPLLRMNHRGVMYLDPCIMTRLNITQLFAKIITPCRPVSWAVQIIRSNVCGRTA